MRYTSFPVIKASEMASIEKKSIEEGADSEAYMDRAASEIAYHLFSRLQDKKKIALLIGKGNNGGDAFQVGTLLQEKGFEVTAYLLTPLSETSSLCQKKGKAFSGLTKNLDALDPSSYEVLIDGLFGTGFQGEVKEPIRSLFKKINAQKKPLYAIDIPSGLSGDTGVASCALLATETFALGSAKTGFFHCNGYEYIGKLTVVDFGLDPKYFDLVPKEAYLIDETSIKKSLPNPKRTQHKYEAGYVLALAGSPGMPGAAILATKAALRSGAGIVRLFHPEKMEEELSNAPVELVRSTHLEEIFKEAKRAKSLLIGPGLSRTEEAKKRFDTIFSKINLPTVIDADGLYFLSEKEWEGHEKLVLTPHRQEMSRLLKKDEFTIQECQAFVDQKKCILVLKGAPTWIFHPDGEPYISTWGDPGMATAGTGDVLTGIIAALLAKSLSPLEAALLGVYIHGRCGELAAERLTSRSLIASDLIDQLATFRLTES